MDTNRSCLRLNLVVFFETLRVEKNVIFFKIMLGVSGKLLRNRHSNRFSFTFPVTSSKLGSKKRLS